MTENEIVKQAIRCIVGACDEACKGYDAKESVCHGYSEVASGLETVLKDYEQYKEVGTVEECRVAVERMKPKKAKGLRICNQACCPNCNTVVLDDEFWMLDEYTYYCDSCGQAVKGIDWSE